MKRQAPTPWMDETHGGLVDRGEARGRIVVKLQRTTLRSVIRGGEPPQHPLRPAIVLSLRRTGRHPSPVWTRRQNAHHACLEARRYPSLAGNMSRRHRA